MLVVMAIPIALLLAFNALLAYILFLATLSPTNSSIYPTLPRFYAT